MTSRAAKTRKSDMLNFAQPRREFIYFGSQVPDPLIFLPLTWTWLPKWPSKTGKTSDRHLNVYLRSMLPSWLLPTARALSKESFLFSCKNFHCLVLVFQPGCVSAPRSGHSWVSKLRRNFFLLKYCLSYLTVTLLKQFRTDVRSRRGRMGCARDSGLLTRALLACFS